MAKGNLQEIAVFLLLCRIYGKPFNSMVNTGAIMICALLTAVAYKGKSLSFIHETYMNYTKMLVAGEYLDFKASSYISKIESADELRCLCFGMKSSSIIPSGCDVLDSLDLLLKASSVEVNAESLSIVAATLANGGINPLTDERILSTDDVKEILSAMYSYGLYQFSGESSFTLGLPLKSSTSGGLIMVVPKKMGIAMYSPLINDNGISNRSYQFCKDLPVPPFRKKNGLSILSAAVFIAGEMAGSGILALPRAVVDSGWIGIALVIVFCVNSCYGGTRLGLCWDILEERYAEYKGSTRNPYPAIAEKAVGHRCRKFVSACIQITLFGVGVVYLLLASQIFQELLKVFLPKVTFCSWFLLFAALITPPMWLGSPKDFLLVGVGAIVSTAIACILIFIEIVTYGIKKTEPTIHVPHDFKDFFLSFGVILFAFGGAATFPTIQNDMANRNKFSKSVYAAFVVILLLYLPIAVGAYFVYGENTNANIILSLNGGILITFANIFLVVHLVLAFLIVINPVAQELENIFDVPHEFCFLRCIVRTSMVLVMVMIGESVPQFSKILALIGGSTVALLTFVLPNYFYMKLCHQESPDWAKREIPLHMKIYMWELIGIGLIGGMASTYSAIHTIFSTYSISKPCYWV